MQRRFLAAVAITLTLAGCGLTEKQRDEVSDIADESADLAVTESERVEELEQRVDALEAKLN